MCACLFCRMQMSTNMFDYMRSLYHAVCFLLALAKFNGH